MLTWLEAWEEQAGALWWLFKDTNPLLSGPPLISLFNPNYFLVGPTAKYSHSEELGGLEVRASTWILIRHNSSCHIFQTYKIWFSLKYPLYLTPNVPSNVPFQNRSKTKYTGNLSSLLLCINRLSRYCTLNVTLSEAFGLGEIQGCSNLQKAVQIPSLRNWKASFNPFPTW